MSRPDGPVERAVAWGRAVLGLCLGGVLLLGIGWGQDGRAQSPPPDSQQMRPPGVERVRQRIREIRQTPTHWRQRLGSRLLQGEGRPASPRAQRPRGRREGTRVQQRGATRADLRRVERRLQALIRELLADRYEGRVSPRVAERFRFVPPDTGALGPARVAAPTRDTITRDTITVVDTVRVPPDTIRDTRIETVERRLLDTGVFRGFEVNFAFGKSTLQPRATRTLDAVGAVLQRYPDLRLEIGGHTDAAGAEGFNQRLSEARADAVRTYLLRRFDIAPDRLVARGYGESRPVASNEERSGRALNRRVEFRVLNPEAMP